MSLAFSSIYQAALTRLAFLSRFEKLFLLLVFFLPLQKKFKLFHSLSAAWNASFTFPDAFQKAIYFYISDLFLIAIGGIFLYRIGFHLLKGSAKYLSAFLLVCLISIFCSSTASYPLHYVRLGHLFLFLLLFCAASDQTLLPNRKELITRVFWVLFFLALFESAVALLQYFLQDTVGLKYLGEGKMLGAFVSKHGLSIFDQIFHKTDQLRDIKRSCGTFLHPNLFGGFMFVSILATYHLFYMSQEKRKQVLLAVAIFMQVLALFTSFSRSALFALLFATLVWLLCKRRERRAVLQVGSIFIVSLLLSLFLLFPAIHDRGGVVNYNQTVQVSDQGRVIFQDIAKNMIGSHLWIGVGYNSYVLKMQEYYIHKLHALQFFPVHNIYLLVAAEEGILGLFFFLLFLTAVILKGIKSRPSAPFSPITTLLSIFLGLLFIGGCDFYLLGSQQGKLLLFLIAGLLNGGIEKNGFRSVPE